MDEMQRDWDPSSDVYYRVYRGLDGPVVVVMQWFDEYDYDESRFLDPRKFQTEAEAQAVIRQLTDATLDANLAAARKILAELDAEMPVFDRHILTLARAYDLRDVTRALINHIVALRKQAP